MSQRTSQQISRFLRDRATGLPVGPFVPVFEEDWPYQSVAPHESLWRYMDDWKLEKLLTSRALYFARADKFTDPFEGRFAPANLATESASDVAWREAYGWALDPAKSGEKSDHHRSCVFISCWQRARMESAQMWREYTSAPESVVIVTSAKALTRFLPQSIVKSAVRYHGADFARTRFDNLSLFFYKPQCYAFEREFRLVRPLGKGDSVRSDCEADFGRLVPVRLQKIVHRVITHPRASNGFKARVEALLREHLPGKRREDSAL